MTDSKFPERMYIYNYRLFDRHKKRVISLAVLADNHIFVFYEIHRV